MKEVELKRFQNLALFLLAFGLYAVTGCDHSLPGHAHNENGLSEQSFGASRRAVRWFG